MQSSKISLHNWLSAKFDEQVPSLASLSGDAGFRSYYRFSVSGQSYLAVDAPPAKSNNLAFVNVQTYLAKLGVKVPKIIAQDLTLGYFCIEDLGDCLLADVLSEESVIEHYKKAIKELLKWVGKSDGNTDFPDYDAEFVALELNIFSEWLVGNYLNIELTEDERKELEQCFQVLIESAVEQPTAFMHRDYHSRNIMVCNEEFAVIDFQDAVIGPITYDIVSLLRDCYVKWPQTIVNELFEYFVEEAGFSEQFESKVLKRWFDLMGLQRHIKASGIFARLLLRDNKPGYIKDIPLTLSYIIEIAGHYPELNFLSKFVSERVLPALEEKT